jgi:ParB-like chromosome segregation protein Spo0J
MNDSTKKPEIVMMPLSELRAYQFNARVHDKAQIAALKRSIKEFGFTNPVLVSATGRIIAGHGRVKAAHEAGLTQVPCMVLDDLSEAQVRAYTIADNQLPQMATWNFDMLAVEIDELQEQGFDVSTLGFNADELTELLGSPEIEPEIEENPQKEPSDTTICPKCHHEFVM